MTAGYSGKPLAEKLGIKPGLQAAAIHAPDHYEWLIQQRILKLEEAPKEGFDFLHAFYMQRAQFEQEAESLSHSLNPGGALWVSWVKKSSGRETDLSENTLRDVLLPFGIVDVKVCAVDETWSALLFRHRRKSRPADSFEPVSGNTAPLSSPDVHVQDVAVDVRTFIPVDKEAHEQ